MDSKIGSVVGKHRIRTFNLDGDSVEKKCLELVAYLNQSFNTYQSLFSLVKCDEAFYTKAEPLRHPLIFYLGHPAVLLVNKLHFNGHLEERINPKFQAMMAASVDEMDWDDLDSTHYEWPKVKEVLEYREKVRKTAIQKLTASFAKKPALPITCASQTIWLTILAIEYQNLHLETVAAIIRQLPLETLHAKHPEWPLCAERTPNFPQNELITVESGEVDLVNHNSNSFGWDNELGSVRKIDVDPFKVSQFLVSNKEFLEFIEDDGYNCKAVWSEEGFQWLQANRQQKDQLHPVYWVVEEKAYQYRSLTQVIDMPWDWPVQVNFHEAKAFVTWKARKTGQSLRLPSEAELSLLQERSAEKGGYSANVNLEEAASCCPVNKHEFAGGVFDVFGNAAQHTESLFDGFEGFKPYGAFDDFSSPKFDMKHNVVKGGSWTWGGARLSRTYRHCLRRHFHEFVGIRYVASENAVENQKKIYETDDLAAMYLELNYGTTDYYGVPNWPKRCADICLEVCREQKLQMKKALDIGCAVGRTPFELATEFEEVVGGDLSARFFQLAVKLRNAGVLKFWRPEEGEIVSEQTIDLKNFKFAPFIERTRFIQQDALNMDLKQLNNFNLIFAGNLIDRVKKPRDFLATIHEYLAPGGIFINASPYTWLRDYSDKEDWVGGFSKDGVNYGTYKGIKGILSQHFEEIRAPMDVEFVIRETRRKFQHTQSNFTFWRLQN